MESMMITKGPAIFRMAAQWRGSRCLKPHAGVHEGTRFFSSSQEKNSLFDTRFMNDKFDDAPTERETSEIGTSGSGMEPYRPENWKELLAEAEASYPERAGPRRSKEKERQKTRLWGIRQQHKVTKGQLRAANLRKRAGLTNEIEKMEETIDKYGFAAAIKYAEAVGNGDSIGLGGRFGRRYLKPK
uniref:Uncharacterized protein n=1 Tax=Octactis speculum TaxID=3111310 RepID=A0A7S2C2C9_9STRA